MRSRQRFSPASWISGVRYPGRLPFGHLQVESFGAAYWHVRNGAIPQGDIVIVERLVHGVEVKWITRRGQVALAAGGLGVRVRAAQLYIAYEGCRGILEYARLFPEQVYVKKRTIGWLAKAGTVSFTMRQFAGSTCLQTYIEERSVKR